MSDMSHPDSAVLEQPDLTIDDLFADLAHRDGDGVSARLARLATDVMLAEGSSALIDASAYLRLVAREHAVPDSATALRLRERADELSDLAGRWRQAADSVAIAIRAVCRS